MTTTTGTLGVCQQKRPPGDGEGKEIEVGGGGRESSEQGSCVTQTLEVKLAAQGKTVPLNEISVLSRWLFMSGLYTSRHPDTISHEETGFKQPRNHKTNFRALRPVITHKQDHLSSLKSLFIYCMYGVLSDYFELLGSFQLGSVRIPNTSKTHNFPLPS